MNHRQYMDVGHILDELRRSKAFRDDAVAWWREHGQGVAHDTFEIIEGLLEDHVWRWLPLIGHLLPEVAEDERFEALLVQLVERVGGDLAGGPLWDAIFAVGSGRPDLGRALAERLLSHDTPTAAAAAAVMVAGVAKKDAEWALAKIRTMVSSGSTTAQLAGIRAVFSAHANGTMSASDLFPVVSAMDPVDDPRVLVSYLSALSRVWGEDKPFVEGKLVEFAGHINREVKAAVLHWANELDGVSLATKKAVVAGAGPAEQNDMGYELARLLSSIFDEDRAFVLDVMKRGLDEGLLWDFLGTDGESHLLEELRKKDRGEVFAAIESWLGDPPSALLVQGPQLLEELFKDSPGDLVASVAAWTEPRTARLDVRLRVLQSLISQKGTDPVADVCTDQAFALAQELGVDVKKVTRGESDRRFQALRLIAHLIRPPAPIDYDQLFTNLDAVPHVRAFMGISWFERARKTNDQDNPLLRLLSWAPPTDDEVNEAVNAIKAEEDAQRQGFLALRARMLLDGQRTLPYWDDVFAHLDPKKPGIGKLRTQLKNAEETLDALCEAEVLAALERSSYPTTAKVKVPGTEDNLDLQVQLTQQKPYLEVYNPQMDRRMRLTSGVQRLKTHRLKLKLLEKFQRQLEAGAAAIGEPVLIVVNGEGTALGEIEIAEAFLGTMKFRFWVNTKTGEHVDGGTVHDPNSLTEEIPATSVISGVILYRRNMTGYDRPVLEVEHYPNPLARTPLTDQSVRELCGTLSPVWRSRQLEA